jgi:regulator of replication initiation timing
MKDGKKETSTALGIRTSTNAMILANHVVSIQQRHAALALEVANTVRRLEGKIAHAAAKESVDVTDITEVAQLNDDVARHGVALGRIEREQARLRNTLTVLDAGNSGAKEDGTGSNRVDLLAKEVKGEFTIVYSDIAALQDSQARRASHDEDYATLEARVDTLVAENDKLVLANKLLEDRVAAVEAKPPKKNRTLGKADCKA